jgi:hypothetical protein
LSAVGKGDPVVSAFDRVPRPPVINKPVLIGLVGNTKEPPRQNLVGGMARSGNPALHKKLSFGEEINHVSVIQLFEKEELILGSKLVARNNVWGEPIPIRQGPVFDIQKLGSKWFLQDRFRMQPTCLLGVRDPLRANRERR